MTATPNFIHHVHQGLRSAGVWTSRNDAAFRRLTLRYEDVCRHRMKVRQHLAAHFEGGDPDSGDAGRADTPVAQRLADIRHGRSREPSPMAGTYHALCKVEQVLHTEVGAWLMRHPVGPWLAQLHGVGTMLAARLVTLLDRGRAPRPSSFWAYCGLATVPAVRVRCRACGAEFELAVGAPVPADHADQRDELATCRGDVAPLDLGDAKVRVATARGGPATDRTFDQLARVTCHLIGQTMVRTNGTYAPVYHEARERLQRERDGWSGGRIHLTALRVMEKRFLLDLWHAWPLPCAGHDRLRTQRPHLSPSAHSAADMA